MTEGSTNFSTDRDAVIGGDAPNITGGLDPDTILAQMREEASQGVDVENISLVVPERPNFELLFRPDIDYDLLNLMMKKAKRTIAGGKKEWHPVAFAFSVMSHTNIGVAYKGQTVSDEDGDDLLITSPMFHNMFNSRSLQQAIKALYIKEGHIIATAQKVVEEAGYGDLDIESGEGGPLDD